MVYRPSVTDIIGRFCCGLDNVYLRLATFREIVLSFSSKVDLLTKKWSDKNCLWFWSIACKLVRWSRQWFSSWLFKNWWKNSSLTWNCNNFWRKVFRNTLWQTPCWKHYDGVFHKMATVFEFLFVESSILQGQQN